jgi:zinc transporter ZupT
MTPDALAGLGGRGEAPGHGSLPTSRRPGRGALGYLIAAIVATAGGPLLYGLLHERPSLTRYVDLFVYVAVPLLVVWQIVPSAWESRSLVPLLALGAGFLVPLWIGRASETLAHGTDAVTLLVGLGGLLLHALFEGAGLAPLAQGRSAPAFGSAVVLHRLVEGLVVWWILRPSRGVWAAVGGVAAVVLVTVIGFGLGRELLGGQTSGSAVETFEALVAGSLLHVILHQGRRAHTHAEGSVHRH